MLIYIVILLIFSPFLQATTIEHIQVTANAYPQSIEQTLATIDVLDRQAIEQSAALSLPQLLQKIPGIQITTDGGLGQNSSLFVQGSSSGQSLILIDGVKVGSATLGFKSISNISLDQIEQIEVVKGPRAAWFGHNAVGSVILITTRKPENHSITMTYGINDYHNINTALGLHEDDFQINLQIGQEYTQGFTIRDAGDPDNDGYENTQLTLTGKYQISKKDEISIANSINSGWYEFDFDFGSDQSFFHHYHNQIKWQHHQKNWAHELALSQSRDRETFTGSDETIIANRFETKSEQIDQQLRYHWNEYWTGQLGTRWLKEDISNSKGPFVSFNETSRITRSLFLGSYWQWDKWSFNQVVRRDTQSAFADKTTYHVSVGYDYQDNLQIILSQGTAYKAPTFNDLFSPFGGDPNLKAESSKQRELTINWVHSTVDVEINLFDNQINQLIQFTPDDDQGLIFSAKNFQAARIRGITANTKYHFYRSQQQLSVTLLSLNKGEDFAVFAKRAQQTAYWQGAIDYDVLKLEVQANYVGQRAVGFADLSLGSYTEVNMSLLYQLTKKIRLKAQWRNLFDRNYSTSFGFNTAGSAWYLGVTIQ